MLQETVLVDLHRELNGKLVDFGGWNMPLHYGSQIDEHHAVRESAGWFDVSHMTVVDVTGADAKSYLQHLLANDVNKLSFLGKALYSAMLNEQGGVIDDLIVYLTGEGYRLVVNCATREKDLAWMNDLAKAFDVELKERPELAMVAVQGPKARDAVHSVLANEELNELKVFSAKSAPYQSGEAFVARTGYTGEDGYEVILPEGCAEDFVKELIQLGVKPCGLGARDTLRLEAGMNLYGHEMDDTVSPLVANMAWTVAWAPEDRQFIGRTRIEAEKSAGVKQKLVGLVIDGKGVLRAGQEVSSEQVEGEGVITSGTFSPTMKTSIALARVPVAFEGAAHVSIRGKAVPVKIVAPCFVRKGKVLV